MKRSIYVSIFSWTIVGLIVGYLLFGKSGGELIPLEKLFMPADNMFQKMSNRLVDINSIRLKIVGCGFAGFAFGFVLGKIRNRK